MAVERKYKCKYCGKMITNKLCICTNCEGKLRLVRKLLRMVKEAKNGGDTDV